MRRLLEYLGYRTLGFLVPLLPRPCMVWLGRRLGGAYFFASPKARRFGMENLRRALPERSDHRRILLESLRLQGVALLDALWSRRVRPGSARKYAATNLDDEERLRRLATSGKGLAVATAHFGSWEMLNLASGTLAFPPITFIARPVRNPWIDKHLKRSRERTGNRLVYRERALITCMGALRRGEIVASVIDMNVVPAEGGIFVDFFGTLALTSVAVPLLAARVGCPLAFAVCVPVDKGKRYRVEVEEIPIERDAKGNADVMPLMERLNAALEEKVRATPEAWIWSYKRWKRRPSELPGDYPSYALWVHPHA